MAEPITSARSQAAMAISAVTQRKAEAWGEYTSAQSCARSRLVAMPSFTVSTCRNTASSDDSSTTDSSEYSNSAPPAMSVAQFPALSG